MHDVLWSATSKKQPLLAHNIVSTFYLVLFETTQCWINIETMCVPAGICCVIIQVLILVYTTPSVFTYLHSTCWCPAQVILHVESKYSHGDKMLLYIAWMNFSKVALPSKFYFPYPLIFLITLWGMFPFTFQVCPSVPSVEKAHTP